VMLSQLMGSQFSLHLPLRFFPFHAFTWTTPPTHTLACSLFGLVEIRGDYEDFDL
jgi:hypothetical protein